MKKKKFTYYSYQDKVKYYSDILLDNKTSKNKKNQARYWLEKNYQNDFKANSKLISKNENVRVRTGVSKQLDSLLLKPFKKRR